MNLIMTSSPIAIVGCGFRANQAASVVSAHALAMFAPSFITGKLIEKYGEKSIISSGMTLFLLFTRNSCLFRTILDVEVVKEKLL